MDKARVTFGQHKKYDLDYIILSMLESLEGKTNGVLIGDMINTENNCVISDNEHIKLGSFLGDIVRYD